MAEEGPKAEQVFLENLPLLERVVSGFARRYGMSADEASELESSIKLRIIESGYAIIHKFRGESSLSTYLTVAITMLAREQRIQEHGRWRPSAAAVRHGAVAVGLETLVHQKGYSLTEAGGVLRSRGATTLSDRELGDLLRQLPRRGPLRPVRVEAETLRSVVAADEADAEVVSEESAAERDSVSTCLEGALASLSLEDRLLLKLRFWEEATIADAARVLGVDQRPLYRRIERLFNELREHLARKGITAEQVRDLIGGSR